MKKILVWILIGSMLMTAGCSGKNKTIQQDDIQDEKVQIKEITFAVNETPLLTMEFWDQIANKYMDENPGVKITLTSQPSANVTIKEYLKTLLATDQFPDVMVMTAPMEFVSAGALLELDPDDLSYIENPTVGQIDGKTYVAPYKKQLGGMFYNKDIFKQLDLDIPDTYDDLVSICQKLKDNDVIPISIGLKDGWAHTVLASLILSSDLLESNPNWGIDRNEGKEKFTSPEFVKSMEKYKQLTGEYGTPSMASVTYAQQVEMFFTQRAAMMPMGSWLQGEEENLQPDFETGFFAIPADNGSNVVPVWVNEGLSISAKTKHPEVCKDFIRYFFQDKEWYGEFLKSEMLFTTTKEPIEYEKSRLRKEIEEYVATKKEVENWYDMTGDAALLPGLGSYMDKMTQRLSMGADVAEELELFEKEWEKVKDTLE